MNQKETLYICLPENAKELFLLPKSEVEKSIKSAEEDPNTDLEYTVIGSIKSSYTGIPYLISYKIALRTEYDVVYAKNGLEAHALLTGKKRLQDKQIKITNTLDLRKLIAEYYE
jgi:hypothetical protein